MQNTAIIYNTNKLPHVKALPVLGGCLLLSAAVCVAQVLGNSVILLLCLLGYLVFTVWACNKGIVFPVLLYFLPWSPLLKMYNGGISFFTIAASIMLHGFPSAEQNVFAALPDYPCCTPYGADISDQGHTT